MIGECADAVANVVNAGVDLMDLQDGLISVLASLSIAELLRRINVAREGIEDRNYIIRDCMEELERRSLIEGN